jgi:hypothetical protein
MSFDLEPQEVYVFRRQYDSDLRKQCPHQCADDVNGDNCQDSLSHNSLKDSKFIASVSRDFVGEDGTKKHLTTCYDEPALRKWDASLAERSERFTDPLVRTLPLVWPATEGQTKARVIREREQIKNRERWIADRLVEEHSAAPEDWIV